MAHFENASLLSALNKCAMECDHSLYLVSIGNPDTKQAGRLTLDCADICRTTAAFVSRGSKFAGGIVGLCANACDACAQELEKFDQEDLRRAAQACREAAEECNQTIGAPAQSM